MHGRVSLILTRKAAENKCHSLLEGKLFLSQLSCTSITTLILKKQTEYLCCACYARFLGFLCGEVLSGWLGDLLIFLLLFLAVAFSDLLVFK